MSEAPTPDRGLYLERAVWTPGALARFAGWAVGLTVVLSLVGGWLATSRIPAGDAAVLDAVATLRTSGTVSVARVLTFLADLSVVAALMGLLGVVLFWRFRRWDVIWLTLAAVGGALFVTGVVKVVTDRARPDGALADTVSSSFPSGHAVRGVVVYGLIAWCLLRLARSWWRHLGVAVALLLAVATGWSRVWLAVHWPSDVLFGYVLGATWLLITLAVTQPRLVRRAAPAPDDEAPGPRRFSGSAAPGTGRPRRGSRVPPSSPARRGRAGGSR